MTSLMMETISSEADSHFTSHFIGDKQPLGQRTANDMRQVDPDYMQRVRPAASNSTQDLAAAMSPSRDIYGL